jgi:hypothetical protein
MERDHHVRDTPPRRGAAAMTDAGIVLIEAGLSAPSADGDGTLVSSPSLLDVVTMLSQVDGREFDQLYIRAARGPSTIEIGVDGGSGGQVVFSTFEDPETHYIRAAERPDGPDDGRELITSGGQRIEVLSRWLVPRDTAARALWFLLLAGELDPGLEWDRLSDVDL